MIPLRDSIVSRTRPVVTGALIVANLLVFAWELLASDAAIDAWALVPGRLVTSVVHPARLPHEVLTLVSSMFLHGGVGHLLGNLWFLWIFGDNVEDRLGPRRYLAFYLSAGLAAAAGQILGDPLSAVPMVGASGAIAGVLGAYTRAYPRSRVYTFIPILIFPWFIEVPAIVFLGVWFLSQVLSSLGGEPGVAWYAHIAGFLFGFFAIGRFPAAAPPQRRTWETGRQRSWRARR